METNKKVLKGGKITLIKLENKEYLIINNITSKNITIKNNESPLDRVYGILRGWFKQINSGAIVEGIFKKSEVHYYMKKISNFIFDKEVNNENKKELGDKQGKVY